MSLNLRSFKGKVPIDTGRLTQPVLLVGFPKKGDFYSLWSNRTTMENRRRYYSMMLMRKNGSTFDEVAQAAGVTKERVRQVEAKFLRLMKDAHLGSK